jgi:hypothetical protein
VSGKTQTTQARAIIAGGLRRVSALACLASAYQFAVTLFDLRWLAATAITAAIASTGARWWADTSPPPTSFRWPSRWRFCGWLLPGWLIMASAAAGKATHQSPRLVLIVWLIGLAWLLGGAWRLSAGAPPRRRATAGVWISGIVIVAFAAAIRLWSIDTVPRDVHCDEGTIPMTARALWAKPDLDWFAPPAHAGAYAMMQLHFSLAALGTLPLGFNLVGARMSDVVLGILSIALLFDGVRRVTNLRVATVSAMLLAANHCHVAFSRIASGYIQSAFVVSLAFAVLSRVWTAPTIFNAVLLGIVMALGVQTYSASVMSLPLLFAALGLVMLLHPRRRRPLLVPLSLFVVTLITAGAPFGVALWQQGDEMMARSREINIFSPAMMGGLKSGVYHTESTAAVVGYQAWNAIRGFHVGHDAQPQYGIDLPMADPYTAALMIPGAVLVVLGLREFAAINALVFTSGYLLLGLGLQYAPGFNRTTGALPLGMVVPAIAIVQSAATFWAGRRRWCGWARDLTLAGVVALCVAANLQIYFVGYGRGWLFGDVGSEAGWVARQYAPQYTIHLPSFPQPGPEGLRMIIADLPITLPTNPDALTNVNQTEPTGADLFVVRFEDKAARDSLLARFPDARVQEYRRHPVHGPTLYLIFVGQPRTAGSLN